MTSQLPESAQSPVVLRPPGTIYTFYSYKGGVGRSMAVVNIGVLLALQGKRVLLVDWDLEAPGLEVYFEKSPNAKLIGDPTIVPGIVDLLESRAADRELPWKTCLLKAEFLSTTLDIISAGSRTPDYRARLQKLDWETLYSEHHIGNFIDGLREQWRAAENYDFILIDSRTGVTDIGDICTVLLPDAIVLMFVTNYQNIEGIKNVMARAEKARKSLPVNRAKLHGIPLPARAEVYAEYEKSLEWTKRFGQEFADLYREWLPREVSPDDALTKLFIPYVTNWSFGERIPVLENAYETQNPTSVGAAYQRIANLLASGLDWYSLSGRVTVEELQGTQVAVLKERERAKELEQAISIKSADLEVKSAALEVEQSRATRTRFRSLILIGVAGLLGIAGALFTASLTKSDRVLQGSLSGLPQTDQVSALSHGFYFTKQPLGAGGLADWKFVVVGKDPPSELDLYVSSEPVGNATYGEVYRYLLPIPNANASKDLGWKYDKYGHCFIPNSSLGAAKKVCGERSPD